MVRVTVVNKAVASVTVKPHDDARMSLSVYGVEAAVDCEVWFHVFLHFKTPVGTLVPLSANDATGKSRHCAPISFTKP